MTDLLKGLEVQDDNFEPKDILQHHILNIDN